MRPTLQTLFSAAGVAYILSVGARKKEEDQIDGADSSRLINPPQYV